MYIIWIRHAHSCANYLHSIKQHYNEHKVRDAMITDLGIVQTNIIFNIIQQLVSQMKLNLIPIFFTSNLRRTMETAIGINSNIPIIPINHINELRSKSMNLDVSNEPRNKSKIKMKTKQLDCVTSAWNSKGKPKTRKPSVSGFYGETLSELIDCLDLKNNSAIMCVSHGGFIKKVTGIGLGNTGIVLQKISVTPNDIVINDNVLVYEGHRKKNLRVTKCDVKRCNL